SDLDGDGIADLVVANNLFGFASLSLYRGDTQGNFTHLTDLKVGTAISDLNLADVNKDGRTDLLVTNSDAGDLSVFLNAGFQPGDFVFPAEMRLRAGNGPYGVKLSVATLLVADLARDLGIPVEIPNLYFMISNEETNALASGDFDGD